MDKHAYLVIAHNELYIFDKLLDLLNDVRNDIYIYIDAKSNITDFKKISEKYTKSDIIFCKNRIKIYWGDFTLVLCEMELFNEVYNSGKEYSRIHLISGVDLPLKSQNYIHSFFDEYPNKEFVQFCNQSYTKKANSQNRYRYYSFMHFNSRSKLGKIFLHIYLILSSIIQRFLRVDRFKKENLTIGIGSNWVSITPAFLQYIVEHEEWVKKHFSYTVCGDEGFIQTLLYNSTFVAQLYDPLMNGGCKANMRYIDWDRGRPYTWRVEDFDELINSPYLYARKFNSQKDKAIIDKLYFHVRKLDTLNE